MCDICYIVRVIISKGMIGMQIIWQSWMWRNIGMVQQGACGCRFSVNLRFEDRHEDEDELNDEI